MAIMAIFGNTPKRNDVMNEDTDVDGESCVPHVPEIEKSTR